jgi:amino acid transporter
MSDGALSHEEEDHKKSGAKHAGIFDIYILGITIVIGGQIFSWNVGLAGGLWEAFVAMVVTGIGFLFLVLCLSEMTSALPFSGNLITLL